MKSEDLTGILKTVSELQVSIETENHKACEEFWNSLSEDEKIKVFYSVVSRIVEGELHQKRSFRGILYDVFNFGPKSYSIAMDAGYMGLHNALVEYDEHQKEKAPFICGMPGEKDKNGMSEYVIVCPEHGSDVTYLYQKIDIDDNK